MGEFLLAGSHSELNGLLIELERKTFHQLQPTFMHLKDCVYTHSLHFQLCASYNSLFVVSQTSATSLVSVEEAADHCSSSRFELTQTVVTAVLQGRSCVLCFAASSCNWNAASSRCMQSLKCHKDSLTCCLTDSLQQTGNLGRV